MNYPTLPKNWNILPNEIKVKIVKNLNLSSRLALRSCSVDDWKLVESVPFRKIHYLRLTGRINHEYQILLQENYYSRTKHEFVIFENFQEKLLKILDNVDYIKKFDTVWENTMENIKLMPRNQKIKVKELTLNMHRSEDCLQQVDASILEKINLISECTHVSDELCDMPQFNSVDELEIQDSNIRDDQLWKIKSKKFNMKGSGNLKAFGIGNYIKTRSSDPNLEELVFYYLEDLFEAVIENVFGGQYEEWKWFVHPSFPEFETYIDSSYQLMEFRRTRTNSTVPSNLKNVEIVEIGFQHSSDRYELCIKKKAEVRTEIETRLESREKIQEVLTEKLTDINYIKKLTVFFQCDTHCWRLLPKGSLNRITVGHLTLNCDTSNKQFAIDLLEQIEPGHLKCVELYGEHVPNDVFNMQQVIQADYVEIPSKIQDYQLMRLSATKIRFRMRTQPLTNYEEITASGTNKFIKKCLLDLNKQNYDIALFPLVNCEYREFVSTLFDGLDIFSMKNDQEKDNEFYPSEVIVNSNWDDFKLKIRIRRNGLEGKRIKM